MYQKKVNKFHYTIDDFSEKVIKSTNHVIALIKRRQMSFAILSLLEEKLEHENE